MKKLPYDYCFDYIGCIHMVSYSWMYIYGGSLHIPEGSTPQGEEKTIDQEQLIMGNVIGMMRYFQRMSKALLNFLDFYEGGDFVTNEGSQRPLAVSGSVH
jgi:hypothetical protein